MKGKSFRWLVVGAGREEYEARLRLQTESLGMNRDVLMADALFPALPVYRIASVVVMPSENEAFGMVLAEASAFGVPVIAIGVPTVVDAATLVYDFAGKDASDAAGLFVTPRDIDRSVRDISKLIGYSINLALHEGLTIADIDMFVS